MLPYVNPAPRSISLTFVDGDPACFAHPKLFSDALLGALFKDLGLSKLFASIKASRHIQFDLVNFVRLITFGRIINPASKAATIRQNDDYLYPLLDPGFNKDNVYDMLDIVYENRQRIFRTINKKLVNKQLRDTSVIFYDVTNLYFETDQPDEDTESKLVGLVDDIIRIKKENKDTSEIEGEVDKIVYSLYGLSDEEIKIIEGE